MVINENEVPESHPQYRLYKQLRDAGVPQEIAQQAVLGLGKDDMYLYTAAENLQAYELRRRAQSLAHWTNGLFFFYGVMFAMLVMTLWKVFTR